MEHTFANKTWNNPSFEQLANELCTDSRLLMLDGYVANYDSMAGLTYERKFSMAIRHWIQNTAVDLDNGNSHFAKEVERIAEEKAEEAVSEERFLV